MPRNPTCSDCELHKFAQTVCLYGTGNPHAQIMLVGEAPGAEEDKHGRPFVGAAGGVLDRALNEAGLTRQDVYISNVAKCRPPQNRTPTAQEVDTCLHYLLDEIETLRPKVVVALGNAALRALTGKKAISQEHGKIHPARRGLHIEPLITATYHPASVLYDGRVSYPLIVEDFRRVKAMIEGSVEDGHTIYWALPGDRTIEPHLGGLADARVLSCDLEWTHGGDKMAWPWSNLGELFSIALTGRVDGELVTVALGWPPARDAGETLLEILKTRPLVFHNAMADAMWVASDIVPLYRVALAGDTMLLAYLLDETQKLSLEATAPRYSAQVRAGWKGGARTTKPTTEDEWEALLKYNAADTRATLLLFEGLQDAVKAQPKARREAIVRLHSKLLVPAIPVLARASAVGVPIDEKELNFELEQARTRQRVAAEDLAEVVGLAPTQAAKLASSPAQTKQYLHAGLGLDLSSSRKDALADIVEYPAVAAILRYRREQKLISTYLGPWSILLERQGDSRLHSVYRLAGARTGRLSAEGEMGGTLQTMPRNTEDLQFRKLVRAPQGRLVLSGDYSQIELRVIAWLANEPTMLRLFSEGVDLHYTTAAFIKDPRRDIEMFLRTRDWIETITRLERHGAKGVNFGLCFGMQPPKLRDYARINYGVRMTIDEAIEAYQAYFRLYSALPAWHQKSLADAARLGYTETPFGRRRQFESNDVHPAINTPVQSTASDLTLLAMINVARTYEEEHVNAIVVGFVHDSILVDVAERDAERAARMLKEQMENLDTSVFGFAVPVPLVCDLKIGETW